jgi:mannose-6-phosphate isomerase-like protein (cupin superfamily)
MSIGLYALRVGEFDRQKPHREDEVYLVVSGRARFTDSQKTTDVQPGQIIYVTAGMPHRFHAITEDLQLIVVFAPPES